MPRGPLRWLLAALAALPALFGLAVVAGSTLPANRHWQPPRSGVTIHVYTNGVHTGLVLSAVHPLHDWRARIKATDLSNPARAGQWLLFGWGERDFYLNTPRWADVDPAIILRAATGSTRTLMHVDHLPRVWTGADMRPIRLSPAQYRALVRDIEGDFADGPAIAGYGADDVFYRARGRYSMITTCNEWTGAKLRAIGVRIGRWTPASWSVMRWF